MWWWPTGFHGSDSSHALPSSSCLFISVCTRLLKPSTQQPTLLATQPSTYEIAWLAMGMGSKMKRSSSSLVVSCVLLGLALLLVGAAATRNSPSSSCKAQCSGREDYKPCHVACLWGLRLGEPPNCHLRCRHAKSYDACFEQCKKEQEAIGGRVALLVAAAEGQKQGQEERAKGAAGLLAMPTERAE